MKQVVKLLRPVRWFAIFGLMLSFVAARSTAADPGPTPTSTLPAFGVQTFRDIPYRELAPGEDGSKNKNRLDLYLPQGKKDFPVLFFVHGGGWRHGDKDFLGVYATLGRFWAKQGIGAVITNYRLFPEAHHPDQIRDVAKAFAWVHENIARYGGRPDQVFVSGHSAGGHLVSLLATDAEYLKEVGLDRSAIRGVIPISGVYDVAGFDLRLFTSVFGTDPEERRKASPLCRVGEHEPPFLILYADGDFPTCDVTSEKFCRALKDARGEARTLRVKDSNHITILLRLSKFDDPATEAIRDFIAAHTAAAEGAVGR